MRTEEIIRLVDAAGFIFRGSVANDQQAGARDAPRDAGEAVVVRIEHVLRGTPVLRGLVGQEALVISREPESLRRSHSPILFTDCISLGQQLLLREIGLIETTAESREVVEAIRVVDERPLRERVAAADIIVVGKVSDDRPLERPFPPSSEHDPLWSLARVDVSDVLKGRKPRSAIEVLYASSDDRVWFDSPKLHVGLRGIFLLFHVNADETPKGAPRSAYQAIDPLDFQPIEQRREIERLIVGEPEERSDV
jgi:hypothetical protein